MFSPYPSITNKQQQRMLSEVPGDTDWVATAKYHGTNMSVIVSRSADGKVNN